MTSKELQQLLQQLHDKNKGRALPISMNKTTKKAGINEK
jgi:hypothetical protein